MDIIVVLLYCLIGILLAKNLFHFFQLDSYQFPSFFKTLNRNFAYSYFPFLILFLVECVVQLLSIFLQNFILLLIIRITLLLSTALLLNKKFIIKNSKKKLVITARLKRLFFMYSFCLFVCGIIVNKLNLLLISAITYIPVFFISALLAWPIEKLISELYFRDARHKLNSIANLVKIGITGSYGKTSVKNILGHILGVYTPTLISPKSFNTPMGLTITIRTLLSPDYRVFVAEMGSRHLGDINELCRLVHPKIGIISSVGPQHLDTFKNLENVIKGKYELIQNLPSDGHAFFQDDQNIVLKMYETTNISKTLISLYNKNADVYVSDIQVSNNGSKFKITFSQNEEIDCTTLLLGEHNIKNIAISAAVCNYLGMPLDLIAKMIATIKPLQSRMEIINTPTYTIINDAFNSNPVGSKEAVTILSKFTGRKIIITPGMVELGKDEPALNESFGEHIGKNVDIVILIGKKRVEPIKRGILSVGFPEEHLYIVPTLEESTKLLNSIVQNNDVVLYENDLPDNYIDA